MSNMRNGPKLNHSAWPDNRLNLETTRYKKGPVKRNHASVAGFDPISASVLGGHSKEKKNLTELVKGELHMLFRSRYKKKWFFGSNSTD